MTRSFLNQRSYMKFVALALLVVATEATAADNEPSHARYKFSNPQTFHHGFAPSGVEFGFTHSHSSTAAEGFLRGKAAVIQALGNRQLAEAQSAILFEHARALDQDNDVRQTQALHVQQALWRQARDTNRLYREQRLAEGRAKLAVRRATVHRAAYQLSPSQLDVVSGTINWPNALSANKFATQRERLQELVRQHVSYGNGDATTAAEVKDIADVLTRALRSDIRIIPREEYVEAQKFLRGLKLAVIDVQG